ncbi:MAG: selenium-binding protein [Solirubrobacterales bacterium]|nr:selenium-binding protein [Solirubrobacterales bacterium]
MPLKPDPSFYPSPASAIEGPREELAYVVTLNTGTNGDRRPDALTVVDLQEGSATYGTPIGRLDMPNVGDELHHFGWNACSSALCPWAPHPHVERRYLLVPGLRSSRIHVVDVKDDPANPKLVKVVEADELARRTGYSRPHTVHCGPDGLYVSALGAPDGGGPGGVLLLDHDSFDPLGRWEIDRGPQELSYDVWWNIGYDTLLTSEWGTPDMVEDGVNPELLLAGRYGHHLHAWDLRRRRHQQAIDLGPEQQMVLELRPAHDPTRPYGFVGVVISTADLSASVWLWDRVDGEVTAEKVIEIPAEPAETEQLPPALQPFGAVPPLVTDIALSVDDRTLYVSCWGTGELKRFDVSDPRRPRETGSVRLGGIVRRAPHPAAGPVNGGPQMVEVSRDGRRVYLTNSLYASWDAQFYPEGIDGWMVKIDSEPDGGAFEVDPGFYVPYDGERPHQIRLQGGDASSDSYCFPS